jgi:hypothetical protein
MIGRHPDKRQNGASIGSEELPFEDPRKEDEMNREKPA